MSKHIPEDAEGIRYADLELRRRKFKKCGTIHPERSLLPIDVGLPLVFLHHWRDGQQVNQGFLHRYEPGGESGVVLISYLDGTPNDVTSVTEEYLERCTFYLSDHDLRQANRPALEEAE